MGKALTKDFLNEGSHVVGISRSNPTSHQNFRHIPLDLSDPDNYKQFEFPDFDGYSEIIFINNAGSVEPVTKVGKLNFAETIESYHINVLAPIFFVDLLIKKGKSCLSQIFVLNISSGAASYPVEGWGIYCSTKSALDAFSKVVDKEIKNSGLRIGIRNIYPGIVDTPMQANIRSHDIEDFPELERFSDYKKCNKLKSAEEVSSKIILNFNGFFTSDEVILSLY